MPDGINTERWIQLTAEENGITKAKIIYSTNIREIGKTSEVSFFIKKAMAMFTLNATFFLQQVCRLPRITALRFFNYEKKFLH
ncbi:MAG: hypothetical protein L6V90_08960 [Treponema succinifaciens]|nr:MAG: hypothetical protein L6V90_08960 [Treponema succinifaciens]